MRVSKQLCILFLLLAVTACSSFGHKDGINTMPLGELYQNARTSLEKGDYAAAEKAYTRLIGRFPSGRYNEQSQVDLAYAQYKDNKPDDAYSTINRFIKTFPTHKHVDYAYYLRGLINFNRTTGIIGHLVQQDQSRRDQGYRLQAFDDFSQLTRRFPGSKYAADARQRMIFLRNGLARFEVNVATFYLQRKMYVASAHRARYVIEHYQRAPETADALAILGRSYKNLGREKLADQATRVLQLNYPNHPYLKDPDWPHFPSVWHRMIPFTNHH